MNAQCPARLYMDWDHFTNKEVKTGAIPWPGHMERELKSGCCLALSALVQSGSRSVSIDATVLAQRGKLQAKPWLNFIIIILAFKCPKVWSLIEESSKARSQWP